MNADACNSTAKPSFAYVSISIPGLNLSFNSANRAEIVSFFNDHNGLSAIAAGMGILRGVSGITADTDAINVDEYESRIKGHMSDTQKLENLHGVSGITAVSPNNAYAEKADEVAADAQLIQSGEEQTEGDGTPQKRKRRTKAEMEAARAAELAANADAGAVPALPATPVAPTAAPVAAPALPTLPPAPALPAAPVTPPPAMLAGRVIDGVQALIDEGRTPEAMVEWIHAYGLVNAKDVSYETAVATIRLMQDAQLQKIAEALGLLDD